MTFKGALKERQGHRLAEEEEKKINRGEKGVPECGFWVCCLTDESQAQG